MSEHVKLTRLERLPRAVVGWTLRLVCIPLWIVLIPVAIAWNMANDIGEDVVGWCNRKYWR